MVEIPPSRQRPAILEDDASVTPPSRSGSSVVSQGASSPVVIIPAMGRNVASASAVAESFLNRDIVGSVVGLTRPPRPLGTGQVVLSSGAVGGGSGITPALATSPQAPMPANDPGSVSIAAAVLEPSAGQHAETRMAAAPPLAPFPGPNLLLTPNPLMLNVLDANAAETEPGETPNIGRFEFYIAYGTGPLTINYTLSGTAENGIDFESLPLSVTIPSGSVTATVDITPINDSQYEGTETVVLTINPSPNYYMFQSPSAGTVVIADNEKLDLDIEGKSETDEDAIGGLVVKNNLGSAPPRKKIIIQDLDGFTDDVTLGRSNSKVKVFTAASGGTEILFNGTGNKFQATSLPETLYVEPIDASGSMRDVTLSVSAPNVPGDSVKFTVLYVDPIILRRTSGDEMSPGNDKMDMYKLLNSDNDYKIGFPKILRYTLDPGETKWRTGYSYELVGSVHPANFNHPDVSAIKIRKHVDMKTYRFDVLYQDSDGFKPDNNPDSILDSNPAPDDRVYDFDVPAKVWDTNVPDAIGEIYRYRANFQVWAVAIINGQDVDASGLSQYFVRFSLENMVNNGNDWQPVNDIPGDNAADGGTTPLTWNLK